MPHLDSIQAATEQLSSPFHCSGSTVVAHLSLCCPACDGNSLVVNMPASDAQLKALTDLCSEATFGKGMEAVNDPSYRKALALATDKFFTNFDLSAHDILTTIKTAMMPDAASVTAQLYKLNIYRPGDFFKSHVDTPRGDGMFGSLVVCLPQSHTGGALLVRHKGQEQRFDFAAASANTVQWAAFYSDCEHEILPVETGHRITLTYNLYCNKSKQSDGPYLPGLDVDSTNLYKTLATAFADNRFMSKGGKLAFGCQHAYPHTHGSVCDELHTMLKGRDALCYKVLQQLGLEPAVKSVVDWTDIRRWYCEDEEDMMDTEEHDKDGSSNEDGEGEGYEEGDGDEREVVDLSVSEGEEGQKNPNLALREPEAAKDLDCCIDGDYDDVKYRGLEVGGKDGRVMWVCDKGPNQLQWTAASYGNEPSTVSVYSSAAVVTDVPAWGTSGRKQLVERLASS